VSRRRAFTLVEIAVAIGLAAVLAAVAYQMVRGMSRGEQGVNRRSLRALRQAAVLERLLRDVRSCSELEAADGGYRISKHERPEDGKMVPVSVIWRQDGPHAVTRQVEGGATERWDFADVMEAGDAVFTFELEKVEDVLFEPAPLPPSN
jgi:prepilin-type N-terminal cleavage/methylation domain-containing protein